MFKRSSKLTAMLVAAAAVVSIVPASAAEKLETKDGTIDNARAYEGGYIFDGYRTDDDDAALYYNNGSKDVNVDEDEDYDTYSLDRYGDKYATVKDGNDEYLVDLSNGKIDDDETLQDKLDNAANKLKSKISKEDRYDDSIKQGFETDESKFSSSDNTIKRILDNKYGEVWYQYSAKGDSEAINRTTGAAVDNDNNGYYQGFTNDSGKYIDVTQTANIYAYDSVAGKTVKIEEYGKTYGTNKLEAKLDSIEAIAQDEDYIYTITTVEITGSNNAIPENENTQYFVQKISKAQGDTKDGAYLPKSVVSYQLDKDIYGDDDMSDAFNDLKTNGYEAITVNNGELYVITTNSAGDNVKIYNLKLKKDKIETKDNSGDTKKVDAYVVTEDDNNDQDVIEVGTNAEANNWSIDVDGNVWVLDKGTIYKYDGSDFKAMYTVDRSIDQLDVYDENNLIAWCSDGDVYTAVTGGKADSDEDTDTDTDTTVKAGWDKNTDGTWSFYKDGAKATGWVNDNGTWYYLDAAGTMKTGWVQAGAWYYLNASGAMQTGWINDNGTWYYCNASGAMQTGWVNDNGTWYYCNASGAMQTGWLLDGSTWYYLQPSGAMAANTTINGYVLGANGAWVR